LTANSDNPSQIKEQGFDTEAINGNLTSFIESISDTRVAAFLALGISIPCLHWKIYWSEPRK